jgi:WD40 repeat protein
VSPLSGIPTALSATSPDGKLEAVVKGFSIGIFKLSNGILGKGIHSLCCLKDIVSLAFSSDGKLLGATSKNGQTRQWNVMTGKEVKP